MSAPLPRLERIGAWLLAGLMLLAMALLWQPRNMTRQAGAGPLPLGLSSSGTMPEASLRPTLAVRAVANAEPNTPDPLTVPIAGHPVGAAPEFWAILSPTPVPARHVAVWWSPQSARAPPAI